MINFEVRGQSYNKRQISNERQTRIIAGCWEVHRTELNYHVLQVTYSEWLALGGQ